MYKNKASANTIVGRSYVLTIAWLMKKEYLKVHMYVLAAALAVKTNLYTFKDVLSESRGDQRWQLGIVS